MVSSLEMILVRVL